MRINLTEKGIQGLPLPTAEQPQCDYWDTSTRGFGVRVSSGGTKVFVFRYRLGSGRMRRLKLGRHPDMSLAEARALARQHLGDVVGGNDPAQDRQDRRAILSFKDVVSRYLEMADRKHRSVGEERRIAEKDLVPAWGSWPVTDVKRTHVRELVERIALKRKAPVMANRTLGLISRIFNYALDREFVEFSPASRIEPPGEERSRERVLNAEEVRVLWGALNAIRLEGLREARSPKSHRKGERRSLPVVTPATASAFLVQFLTAQRPGEVRGMRWADVDLESGWWTIPAVDSKNGCAHRVPLIGEALEIIKERRQFVVKGKTEFVFENAAGAGSIRHRGKKAAANLSEQLPFEFRAHDLRRTAATEMAKASVRREHIARVLNHIEGGPSATRVYDRYEYDDEKRVALEKLAGRLSRILAGPAPVVTLESSRTG